MRRLAALLPILLLSGCGRFGLPWAADEDRPAPTEVVVATDLPPSEQAALRDLLAAAPGGLAPALVAPSSGRPADLLVLSSPASIEGAVGLSPLPEDALAPLPEPTRGPGGLYAALDRRARVLAVGRLMANVPTGVLDLTEPRFAGRLARPAASDEGLIVLLTSVLADRGAPVAGRVLEGLVANEATPARIHDADGALAALRARTVDLALTDHVAARKSALGDPPPADVERALSEAPFVSVFPDAAGDGVAWASAVLARPEQAPHPAAGDTALRWLLSVEGQARWSAATGAYPVHPGAVRAPGLRPEDTFAWSRTSLAERAELRAQVTALLTAAALP
jgi:ABC-type Fe3+ transport system substrate-binding protein